MGEETLLKLVNLLRDVNKTISMLIDNPESEHVRKMCFSVCKDVSDDLDTLEQEIKSSDL